VQDPEIFLNDLGLSLSCAVESSRPAIIDASHRYAIGFETFFFSDSAAMQEFASDISRYCGTLTDPVSLERFRPSADSPRSTLRERIYLFASDSTKQIFDMMPDNYAWPQHHMIPLDSAKQGMKTM
jgi:YHS domain-containing protein